MECQSERFPATNGFLKLFCSLVSHSPNILPPAEVLAPYLQFVTDSVLIKFTNRSYKNAAEMVSKIDMFYTFSKGEREVQKVQ